MLMQTVKITMVSKTDIVVMISVLKITITTTTTTKTEAMTMTVTTTMKVTVTKTMTVTITITATTKIMRSSKLIKTLYFALITHASTPVCFYLMMTSVSRIFIS